VNSRDRDLAERELARLLRVLLDAPPCAEVTAVATTDGQGHLRPLKIVVEYEPREALDGEDVAGAESP